VCGKNNRSLCGGVSHASGGGTSINARDLEVFSSYFKDCGSPLATYSEMLTKKTIVSSVEVEEGCRCSHQMAGCR
jgi:hypothetical protein